MFCLIKMLTPGQIMVQLRSLAASDSLILFSAVTRTLLFITIKCLLGGKILFTVGIPFHFEDIS